MKPTLFLTGASSGVGRSLASHLSTEFHVLAFARRIDRMREEFADDPDVTPYELDLNDIDAVEATVDAVLAERGPIHYLVNVAAVNVPASIADVEQEAFLDAMRVNALAPVVVMQRLLPGMLDANFGRIINVTSGAPLNCPPGANLYSASKAALNTLTVTAAKEYADSDIKINLMSPGPARTEMAPNGPIDPSACHSTVDYLLSLDAGGPTGRFFWLGYEVPLFPDLEGVQWERGLGNEKLTKLFDVHPTPATDGDRMENPADD